MTRKLPFLIALVVTAGLPHALRADEHAHSHGHHSAQTKDTAKPDAAWLEKARADYPLTTCVVSDEQLGGDMGEPFDFVYEQPGQAPRLVRFCCKSCKKDFLQEPVKYLKAIDDAAAAKAPKH